MKFVKSGEKICIKFGAKIQIGVFVVLFTFLNISEGISCIKPTFKRPEIDLKKYDLVFRGRLVKGETVDVNKEGKTDNKENRFFRSNDKKTVLTFQVEKVYKGNAGDYIQSEISGSFNFYRTPYWNRSHYYGAERSSTQKSKYHVYVEDGCHGNPSFEATPEMTRRIRYIFRKELSLSEKEADRLKKRIFQDHVMTMQHKNWLVASEAILLLGISKNPDAIQPLAGLIGVCNNKDSMSDDCLIARDAEKAIIYINSQVAVPILQKLKQGSNEYAKERASYILRKLQ